MVESISSLYLLKPLFFGLDPTAKSLSEFAS